MPIDTIDKILLIHRFKKGKEYLEKLEVEVIIEPTKKACDTFNKLFDKEEIVAALHLTC